MTIYLVRHGEAAASWQQSRDPGLSDRGKAQSEGLLRFFADKNVASIASSPLLRAQETALPLSQSKNLTVEIMDAFREIPTPVNIATKNRLAWLQACAQSPWREADALLLDWRDNIIESLQQLPDNSVIFTHFMVMNAVVGALCDAPNLVFYQPDYCSVVSLEYTEGGLRLLDSGLEAQSRVL